MIFYEVIKDWFEALISLFFPRCCVVCGGCLAKGEELLCAQCNIELPRTNYHLQHPNPLEKRFWGRVPLEHASAFFFYEKGSAFRHILFRLKYEGRKEIGEIMGRCMAGEMLSSGFFEGMDYLVCVPLHPKKEKARGYNQSEWIARGISEVTGIPLIDKGAVVRAKDSATQTNKSAYQRWENVNGIFHLEVPPETYQGKHLLFIDDVLTTGATLLACIDAFAEVKGLTCSILALGVAGD